MLCKTYELNELQEYKYVVVLSKYKGKILLSRHKKRVTWEPQGGHIEWQETPLEAAKRELYFNLNNIIFYLINNVFINSFFIRKVGKYKKRYQY